MLSWNDFLAKVADKHSLFDEDDRQAFLKKFAQESLDRSKLDAKVATDLNISEATFQRRLGNAFEAFSPSCPDLKSKTKGKFQILRDWLKGGYRDYQETGILPWLIEITSEVNQEIGVNQTPIELRDICGNLLEKQKQLTTNRLMLAKAMVFKLDDIDVDLALVERKKPDKRSGDDRPEKSRLYQPDYEETEKLEYQEFLAKVLKSNQSNKIAVIGEAGAGKTTFLQRIAFWILENTDYLPIWIPLVNLPKSAPHLKEYLLNYWLENAIFSVTPKIKDDFEKQLTAGKVWLLLDGVDEMAASGNPLTFVVDKWIPDWSHNLPVMLTCRLNVWEANPYALNGFKTYRTLWFSEEKVKKFIHDGFQKSDPALGIQLQEALNQPGKERIKDLVRNPLRLMLLCSIWHLLDGKLPDTKAELYQHYVEEVYRWKEDEFRTIPERQQLNAKLGELAKKAIDEQENRFCLRHKFIEGVFNNDSLFQLALKVGWLNQVGVDAKNPLKPVYAFFHPTFEEYFAATAINDWDFFLPPQHQNKPVADKYRIFEPQWKEVILLWLGREDIKHEQKENFIKALVEFDDGIEHEFYKYRSYFIATEGVAEFKECSITEQIVEQIVKWSFCYFHIDKQMGQTFPEHLAQVARAALFKTNSSIGINKLVDLLEKTEDEFNRWFTADILGVINPGNEKAIAELIRILETPEDRFIGSFRIENSLVKIADGNQKAISELLRIVETTEDESIYWSAAKILGLIDPGNANIINYLVKILTTNEEDCIRLVAAKTLGNIDPGNEQAFSELFRLMETTKLEEDRRIVAIILNEISTINKQTIPTLVKNLELNKNDSIRLILTHSLGEIGIGNEKAIAVLLRILETTENEDIRWIVADSLGKIDPGNEKAIAELARILSTSEDESIRWCVAWNLGIINPGNKKAIAALVRIIETSEDEDTCKNAAESLGKIDPGNEKAIAALVRILESEPTRASAAYSLGEIGHGNKVAITALVRSLETTKSEFIRWRVAASLGKIDPGNQKALPELIKILKTSEAQSILWSVASSLNEIMQKELMPSVISGLQCCLSDRIYKTNFDLYEKCYTLIWNCAQELPYSDFYQVWQQDTLANSATVTINLANLP